MSMELLTEQSSKAQGGRHVKENDDNDADGCRDDDNVVAAAADNDDDDDDKVKVNVKVKAVEAATCTNRLPKPPFCYQLKTNSCWSVHPCVHQSIILLFR